MSEETGNPPPTAAATAAAAIEDVPSVHSSRHINIYLRTRPSKHQPYDADVIDNRICFMIPESSGGLKQQEYAFDGVFGSDCNQENIFDTVAKPIILSAVDGYNGTLFAYGQTGSGKTYTITGGDRKVSDRGIIPRALALLFREFQLRTEYTFKMNVCYLEIYNNKGYDLLSQHSDGKKDVEDLPRVYCHESENGDIHIRNLSAPAVETEEQALNRLFEGDMNRMVTATPMNEASSRSHCIFTILITATHVTTEKRRRSKIHLVDLAGSERVSKTGSSGGIMHSGGQRLTQHRPSATNRKKRPDQTYREATQINKSLLFLQIVISDLQKRAEGKKIRHISYRNSELTKILKDSLGGNCMTSMIATISPDSRNLEESMATCRFAQSVACVSNKVKANEEIDPQIMIKKLKKELEEAKAEMQLRQDGADNIPITDAERSRIKDLVEAYIVDVSPDARLKVGGGISKIRVAFGFLKEEILSLQQQLKANICSQCHSKKNAEEEEEESLQQEVLSLRAALRQRDLEIALLMDMLRQGKPDTEINPAQIQATAAQTVAKEIQAEKQEQKKEEQNIVQQQQQHCRQQQEQQRKPSSSSPASSSTIDQEKAMLRDRNLAFESFRKSYRRNQVIEDHKQQLKEKYEEAQSLAAKLKESRNKISSLKATVEQLRTEAAMQGVESSQQSPEELEAIQELLEEKKKSQTIADAMRVCKSEMENLQRMFDQSCVRLKHDFEQWFETLKQSHQPVASSRTGVASVDADVEAFYKAKQKLEQQRQVDLPAPRNVWN